MVHDQWFLQRGRDSNPQPLGRESSPLPLDHGVLSKNVNVISYKYNLNKRFDEHQIQYAKVFQYPYLKRRKKIHIKK